MFAERVKCDTIASEEQQKELSSVVNALQGVSAPARLPGVIDTLSTGYRTLNRHLYLLLVPIVLDVFYWLGPRLSVGPVARQIVQTLEQMRTSPTLGVTTPQTTQSFETVKTMVENMGETVNLFSMLSSPLSIPSVLVSRDLKAPSWLGGGMVVTVATPAQFLGAFVLLFVLGAIVGAVYLGLVAQVVRDGRGHLIAAIRRAGLYASRYIVLVVGLLMAAIMMGLPLALLIGLITLLSPLLGTLLMVVMWAGLLWLYLYAFFTIDALFVSDARPLMAILKSITVVRLSTSSAMGFLLAIVVISLGMPYVWSALGGSEIATLVSILGNAYIGTGLTVASMIFYRDRIRLIVSNQMTIQRREDSAL